VAPAKPPTVAASAAAVRNNPPKPTANPPKPTANPPKPAAAVVQPAREEDDSPVWDQLAPETEEHAAHAQTTPKSGNRSASFKKLLPGSVHADKDRRKMWLVVGIVGAVVTLGIVVICLIAFHKSNDPARSDNKAGSGTVRGPLVVSKNGDIRSVRQALLQAASGDHIVLRDDVIEEPSLTGLGQTYKARNVTIETEGGKRVEWRVPDDAKADYPILEFATAEGWRLQGNIVFDGRGLVDYVVALRGDCPGLALQDVEIKGFKKAGIRVMNCAGSADRHVQMSGLRGSGAANAEAGIAFEIRQNYRPDVIQFIDIVNCQFDSVKQRTLVVNQASIKNVSGIDK
jgi:hypothetical protein